VCEDEWVTCCMERYGRGWEGDVFECGLEIWMQEVNLKEIWV